MFGAVLCAAVISPLTKSVFLDVVIVTAATPFCQRSLLEHILAQRTHPDFYVTQCGAHVCPALTHIHRILADVERRSQSVTFGP